MRRTVRLCLGSVLAGFAAAIGAFGGLNVAWAFRGYRLGSSGLPESTWFAYPVDHGNLIEGLILLSFSLWLLASFHRLQRPRVERARLFSWGDPRGAGLRQGDSDGA